METLRVPGESGGKIRRFRRDIEKEATKSDQSTPGGLEIDDKSSGRDPGSSGRDREAVARQGYPAAAENEAVPTLVALPQRRQTVSLGGLISFGLCVVLPTLVAAVYYIWIASNQYVVEWRFMVRDSNTATTTSAATVSVTTLSAVLGGASSASAPDNYMVTEYIKSPQAVVDLRKRINLTEMYSAKSIDYWSRFDASLPVEEFARYWQYMVTSSYDAITGTASATVKAFTPADALLIAKTLMSLSEDLVNDAVLRPQLEAVRYAEAEVKRAEERVVKSRVEMSEYRNNAAIIEPNSSVVLSNATLASNLRQLIAQYQTDLAAVLSGGVGQNSSQAQSLRLRIKATQEQLKTVEAEVRGAKQGDKSLSEVVGRYEQLDAERQFAQAMLTSTMQSLEQARANAVARRLFVVPFVKPELPQSSLYPDRPVAIAVVAGGCLLLWTISLLLGRSIREHLA